jgi:AraC-like DNA-binding protein
VHRSLKGKVAIGLAALALAAFAGGAYAATQNSGPSTRQAFLDDVAKRLHVTPGQLDQALSGAFDDQLQAAVKDGRLTQAEANALEQRLKRGGAVPALPFGFFGFGPRALLGPPKLFGGIGLLAGPGSLHAAATYLGLSDAQLARQLSSGKSLAQIATTKGKSVSGLEQAMTAAVKTRLDMLVAAKVITATQEQKILARLSARISKQVNVQGLEYRGLWRLPRLRLPNGVPAPLEVPAPPAGAPAPAGLPAPTL